MTPRLARARQRLHARTPRRAQRAYVLVFVMASLALMAIVAGGLALHIDRMRRQSSDLQQLADAQAKAQSARARVLYWLSTRPLGLAASGFTDEQPLRLDGRLYRLPDDALVSLQDERGLLSVNSPPLELLRTTLVGLGTSVDDAATMLDVLQDYTDADSLKRLRGAEADDYERQGLPPPRNDWILSLDELRRMPLWRDADRQSRLDTLMPWLGLHRDRLFNPNTAPLELLKRVMPGLADEQWRRFELMRQAAPFADAAGALRATGIAFTQDDLLFHASNAVRLRVWAPGLPSSLEYNFMILPTGARAPWLIHEVRQSDRLHPPDATTPVENFPVPSTAIARSGAASQPAP